MPNIIAELMQEIARVERMAAASSLDSRLTAVLQGMLRDARQSMAMNSYEAMREALDDLRQIVRPQKKT